jgi:hypothetical protein
MIAAVENGRVLIEAVVASVLIREQNLIAAAAWKDTHRQDRLWERP